MKLTIRIWFCLAVAVIGASIGDVLVESASDHGAFGPGNFTDHSSRALGPALLLGLFLIALHLALRIREALLDNARPAPNWLQLASNSLGPKVLPLVPAIFCAQILALFTTERIEQLTVYGHSFGGTIWLGGPVAISLTVQAVVSCLVTLVAAWVLRAFANATVQLVHLVRAAFATLLARGIHATYIARRSFVASGRSIRVLCRIGERAPPILIA